MGLGIAPAFMLKIKLGLLVIVFFSVVGYVLDRESSIRVLSTSNEQLTGEVNRVEKENHTLTTLNNSLVIQSQILVSENDVHVTHNKKLRDDLVKSITKKNKHDYKSLKEGRHRERVLKIINKSIAKDLKGYGK